MAARLCSRLIAAVLVLPALCLPAAASDRARGDQLELASAGVTVTMDQARIMRLPPRVATIVIGNPLIADATVQAGGLMVLTGKAIGSTNLIALDQRGEQLLSMQIRVRPQTDSMVQVYRGTERETYSCSPICERAMAVGDSKEFFETALGQVRSRDGAASSRGANAAPR